MTTPNSAPVSSNSANLPSSTTRELASATSGRVDKEAPSVYTEEDTTGFIEEFECYAKAMNMSDIRRIR
ncbi:hypothetical protein H4R33_006783, partial [Dimargaris cristalligena]